MFLYAATGMPGEPLPEGWLALPGGCTPSRAASVTWSTSSPLWGRRCGAAVRGGSTQTPQEQAAFASREHLPFPLLRDHEHRLVEALDLPTFVAGGSPARIRRATLVVTADRRIQRMIYPIPHPAGHPVEVPESIRE